MIDHANDAAESWRRLASLHRERTEAAETVCRIKGDLAEARKRLSGIEEKLDGFIKAQLRPLPLFDQAAKTICDCRPGGAPGCHRPDCLCPCHPAKPASLAPLLREQPPLKPPTLDACTVAEDIEEEARAAVLAQPSQGPARAAEYQDSAAFQGEWIGALGVTWQQMQAAMIHERMSPKLTKPATARPVELPGSGLWIATGATHQHGETAWKCLPLYTPESFVLQFPGRKPRLVPEYSQGMTTEERADAYWGVRLTARGEEWIVGPRAKGRQLTTREPLLARREREVKEAAAALPAEAKPAKKEKKPRKAKAVRACRVCGCTEADCSGCIEKTGKPCSWIEADLCSACVPAAGPWTAPVPLPKAEPGQEGAGGTFFGQNVLWPSKPAESAAEQAVRILPPTLLEQAAARAQAPSATAEEPLPPPRPDARLMGEGLCEGARLAVWMLPCGSIEANARLERLGNWSESDAEKYHPSTQEIVEAATEATGLAFVAIDWWPREETGTQHFDLRCDPASSHPEPWRRHSLTADPVMPGWIVQAWADNGVRDLGTMAQRLAEDPEGKRLKVRKNKLAEMLASSAETVRRVRGEEARP